MPVGTDLLRPRWEGATCRQQFSTGTCAPPRPLDAIIGPYQTSLRFLQKIYY